jgi:stage II sporulation protein D
MKTARTIFTLVCAFGLACTFATPQTHTLKKPETIRVLVKTTDSGALLETRGSYKVIDPFSEEALGLSAKSDRHWMEVLSGKLRFGDLETTHRQIALVPQEQSASLLIDGIQYRGVITACAVNGALYFINELPLEEFVSASLSKTLKEPLPEATMHALAIVERTRAVSAIEANSGKNWHVTSESFGYGGYGNTLRKIGIEEATRATRSFILHSKRKGAPFFGFATSWCADSAGLLAPYEVLFQKDSTFKATSYVSASFASKNRPHSKWDYALSKRALSDALGLEVIETFQLCVDPKSQKVFAVRISDGEETRELSIMKLQSLFGDEFIRSNDFKVARQDKKAIYLEGQGEGLGSGLCLYTASQMARFGQNAKEILATFYPDSVVEKIDTLYEQAAALIDEMNRAQKERELEKAAAQEPIMLEAPEVEEPEEAEKL